MKPSTVDVVVTGDERAVLDAVVDAARQGRRVLVVLPTPHGQAAARLRRMCRAAAGPDLLSSESLTANVTVVTNADVVCVDGVDGVEAVVVRDRRTGRLYGVNASAFLCPAQCVPQLQSRQP